MKTLLPLAAVCLGLATACDKPSTPAGPASNTNPETGTVTIDRRSDAERAGNPAGAPPGERSSLPVEGVTREGGTLPPAGPPVSTGAANP